MNYIYLLLNVLMLVTGQVLFKLGLAKNGGVTFSNAWKAIFTPFIFTGLTLYVMTTLLWFVILSRMPLSIAYPFQSLSYVFGLIIAFYIFKEPVSITKWIGVAIIILGVAFIAADKNS
ncbi:Multidrug transporter EmrE [Paenibacillus sp. yr247]|uniref:EamA family transporter n=1 Tax=Paenibacillus sp. yr247 TaxID=1761880 RepID=UPI000880ABC1|nr:EamA family transporter [Paenibacillus sp. yr247]SDN34991.1 Multidrug transporter EmrE [Paenibacillus sp. yr247]